MALATVAQQIVSVGGPGPFNFDLPVDGGTKIFKGTLVCQLTATGQLVPYSTASSEHCVGVAQADVDNSGGADGAKRCLVESHRIFAFKNGGGGDALADTDFVGRLVFGTDDTTVAKTSSTQARKPVGFFMGMQADGRVRVLVDPPLARLCFLLEQLTDAPGTADALRDNIVTSVAPT